VKSRNEHLTWAKQRARICVDRGDFARAVAGLRADLAEHPLTEGPVSTDQARRGFKVAMDAALGPKWIEDFRYGMPPGPQPSAASRRMTSL
jgi:hypothetical protein